MAAPTSTLMPLTPMQVHVHDVERRLETVGDGVPLAVAHADLDEFASINDELGHEVGDKVLASWERTLKGSLPRDAVVHRVGGDEYIVALFDHTAETALILLEEIRDHFTSHRVPGVGRSCGVSIGIASRPPHAASTTELMQAAYAALARAKREGRSRVAIYVEEKMVLKSNYYSRATLDRLAKLSEHTGRTEASLLREAMDDLLVKYRDLM
jgi:diguanylate cyclase